MTPGDTLTFMCELATAAAKMLKDSKETAAIAEDMKYRLSDSRARCNQLIESNAALLEKVETLQKEVDRLGAELLKSNHSRRVGSNESLYYGPGGPGSLRSGFFS